MSTLRGDPLCLEPPTGEACFAGSGLSPAEGAGPAPPRLRTRLVGQAGALAELIDRLPAARLLTLVGPGGIGKTTLAVASADRLAERYRDGVAFVDLAPLAQADALPSAVAAVLQMPAVAEVRIDDLVRYLQRRRLLLILDNCEHVVEVAARLCEAVHAACAHIHVLATSREPLRCAGETVQRIRPLPAPPVGAGGSAAEALGFAAVELLALRIGELRPAFVLRDADAAVAARICRQVDGLPLAIELAAALADQVDLPALAQRLVDAPLSLRNARQPVDPRHQSLHHLLDWSCELLTPPERHVFERLSVFRARFSMPSAIAVAGLDGVDPAQVHGIVISLATQSLVVVEPGADGPQCRYLETTRAFAREKLERSGEHHRIAGRHAQRMCTMFKDAEARFAAMPRTAWLGLYGALIDDVRAALQWSFSDGGDVAVGLALTAASVPLAYQLSLWDEYVALHEQALARLATQPQVDPAVELRLRTAYGSLVGQTHGPSREMNASYLAALQIANRDGNATLRADALDGVWMGAFLSGDYPTALQVARERSAMTRDASDPAADTRTTRMLAQSLHFNAHHREGMALACELMNAPRATTRRLGESSVDPQVSARVILARIHWLQGRPDEAAAVIAEAVLRAESDMSTSVAHAISWGALPIAFWRGDLTAATALLDRLSTHCAAHRLPYWATWVPGYALCLGHATGPCATHGPAPIDDLKQVDMLATLTPAFATDVAVHRALSATSPWCAAEVLRARGTALSQQPGGAMQAADLLHQALALARAQQALGWELRCATSLARLWAAQRRRAAAQDLVAGVHARFREGHWTADLKAARALIKALDDPALEPH